MAIILDLVIIGIVLVFAFISKKRGFARTFIELVGYLAAIVIAFSLSASVANTVYEKNIRPSVIKSVKESISLNGNDLSDKETVEKLWGSLPKFVLSLASLNGLEQEEIVDSISEKMSGSVNSAAAAVADNVVKPMAVSAINIIVCVISFIVLMILFKLLAKVINKVFEIPGLRVFNRTFGFIFGAIKGILIVFVLVTIIKTALPLFGGNIGFINLELIEQTYLMKLFNDVKIAII